MTKADADTPALIPYLNGRIYLGICLSIARVEGMPFAQVLHQDTLGRAIAARFRVLYDEPHNAVRWLTKQAQRQFVLLFQ